MPPPVVPVGVPVSISLDLSGNEKTKGVINETTYERKNGQFVVMDTTNTDDLTFQVRSLSE